MLAFREVFYVDVIPTDIECILVGDIGGTNSNFGMFKIDDEGKPQFLFSLHFKSKEIARFIDVVQDVLNYIKEKYRITIKKACFAAAGVVSETRDFCKPTNLDFVIDAKEILSKTDLTCAFIVNDFEVIGYGLRGIKQENLIQIHEGTERTYSNKVILGAGTGLGKCILMWERHFERYIPVASEGGHADFAAQNQLELDLVTFINKTEKRTCNISWEDVLSGNGGFYAIMHLSARF